MSTVPCADSLSFPEFDTEPDEPNLHLEAMLRGRGRRIVAGVDEAGRGPLAGPVVAAAVVLDIDNVPDGLNDSKKLDAAIRAELFEALAASAQLAWCAIHAEVVDRINIRQATLRAMHRAVASLTDPPDSILVDGRDVPMPLRERAQAVVRGDAISLSIAAASIVAKVVRDRMMERADLDHPGYGFAGHKGYGTPEHLAALKNLGPCILHRRSFAPVMAPGNPTECPAVSSAST